VSNLDILIGPGRLYKAPVSTAAPDESTVAFGAAWAGSWVDMGKFADGEPVTLNLGEDVKKIFSEQSVSPQVAARIKREPVIKVTLQELSATNMPIVLDGTGATTAAAGGGQKGYTEIPFGSQTDVDLYKWGIEAFRFDSNGVKQPVRWFFHKGFLKASGDIAHAKAKESGIPIEIHILDDTGQSAGAELGILQIVTAAATAT
jgi:hypothetical protein